LRSGETGGGKKSRKQDSPKRESLPASVTRKANRTSRPSTWSPKMGSAKKGKKLVKGNGKVRPGRAPPFDGRIEAA